MKFVDIGKEIKFTVKIDFLVFSMAMLWICPISTSQLYAQNNFQSAYYKSFRSSDVKVISDELAEISKHSQKDTLAYSGALKMKLAGLLSSPAEKVKTFKEGRKQLEEAIASDPENVEYRFLRLIIQEHAPGIMKYKSKLEEDKSMIINNFRTANLVLLSEIRRYSASSSVLLSTDLKE